jgi:hypothetical protein
MHLFSLGFENKVVIARLHLHIEVGSIEGYNGHKILVGAISIVSSDGNYFPVTKHLVFTRVGFIGVGGDEEIVVEELVVNVRIVTSFQFCCLVDLCDIKTGTWRNDYIVDSPFFVQELLVASAAGAE